jgi:nitroimidazol reductase NimA-like FMN-containing flavoprotein (pyridoxamine 5'-phosphate oxidase superfamily)
MLEWDRYDTPTIHEVRPAMADAKDVYRDHPTRDEIDDVLGQRINAAVGTINEDGSVHLAFVIFLFEDDRLYLETSSTTRKARNAAARPTASMLVQGLAATGRHLMVAAEGPARVLEGDEAQAVNHRLRAKYIKPEALPAIDRAWGRLDDVSIEVTPVRWRSWTGGLLHAETQRELDMPYDDAWLPDD